MPKISVLMPVYNAERFLNQAIESILNQTFTDFEFLIIDDGSTDNSLSIIQSYSDTRIRLYKNENNLGISQTLNKGIQLSNTNFIARMDADDISYPERLKKQYEYMLAHPDCALVSSLVKVIAEDGRLIRQDDFKSDFYYYNLTFICWIYHSAVMYQKRAVQKVGMYSVPYSEDYELFWQLTRQYKFYNIPEILLDYRVTHQSLHQVLKKQEYAKAQQEQLLRNFRYYAGDNYTIPRSFIQCLQHNFLPLLEEQNISRIIDCLKELDFLSQQIEAKVNVNRDINAIQQAAKYKKDFIISFFSQQLPLHKGLLLLVKVGYFKSINHFLRYCIKTIRKYILKRKMTSLYCLTLK